MKIPESKYLFCLAAVVLAGCGPLGSSALDVETFTLEHRSGWEASELISPYVFLDREDNPGAISSTENAVTVRETRDNLAKIRRVLSEFDQPLPDLRLYFQLIEADSFQDEDPAIVEVVQELRSLFRFGGYRLLGEAVVPVSGGSTGRQNFSQRIMGVENPITIEAAARILPNGTVRLDPVELHDTWNKLLETSVNISPGQTLVIGGTEARTELGRGSATGESTVILTVRAESG